ncbi:MAG: hypothetical protein ACLP7Q_05390 [Isosphaeraceae bacterium]
MNSKKPTRPRTRRSTKREPARSTTTGKPVVLDFVQSRIEAFNEEQGGGVAVRKDAHGYTLLRQDYGTPIARLRPRESGDRFEVLYWSAFRERWLPVGPFGGMVLSLLDALEFIANDPMDC